jgi:hypothetical protein
MYKLFTLEEATELLPLVDANIREMQSVVGDILGLQERLEGKPVNTVETRNALEELRFLHSTLQEDKAQFDRLGVHLKDLEAGLVDFPSQLGAEVVCLSWSQGQEAITHYHHLNEGEAARRPLPTVFQGGAASA